MIQWRQYGPLPEDHFENVRRCAPSAMRIASHAARCLDQVCEQSVNSDGHHEKCDGRDAATNEAENWRVASEALTTSSMDEH